MALTRAAQRAADAIAQQVIDEKLVWLGRSERPEALERIGQRLREEGLSQRVAQNVEAREAAAR